MIPSNLLKKYSFLILLFFPVEEISAQTYETDAFYTTGGLTLGNYAGLDLHANFLLQKKYSFKLGYSGFIRKAKSAPMDFNSGFVGIMSLGLSNPNDQMGNYQLLAGRVYSFNKKGTIRANLALGIGYTRIREPTNWQRLEDGFLQVNYTYDYNRYGTVSLIINPKIEFPFTRYYGLTISPMLQINKDRSYIGIGIGQMLGLLR